MSFHLEILPFLLCLTLSGALIVKQKTRGAIASAAYFASLAVSSALLIMNIPQYAPAIRVMASSILLSVIALETGVDSRHKTRSLFKLPLLVAALAFSFHENKRFLMTLEGALALIILLRLLTFYRQKLKALLWHIAASSMGVLYLLFRTRYHQESWGRIMGQGAKLITLFFIYCLLRAVLQRDEK